MTQIRGRLPSGIVSFTSQARLSPSFRNSLPMACSLVVTQPGLKSYTVRVADVCTELTAGGCQTADLRTVLAPAATGSAGGQH